MYLNIAKCILLNRLGVVRRPSFVTYFVTWRCNCRCSFCEIWKRGNEAKDELSASEIARIFRQIGEVDVLRISGGEPFLRNDLPEIVDVLIPTCRPSVIHITSNGLLTDRIIDFFQSVREPARVHLKLSIDAVGDRHDELRGTTGAYQKVIDTIHRLVPLRDKLGFHLGVNQAIVSELEERNYSDLKHVLNPYRIPIYPVIAHKGDNGLYRVEGGQTDVTYRPLGSFSKDAIRVLMAQFLRDSKKISSPAEYVVDRYYLKGLANRLIKGTNRPNPRCVALNDHLRVLPNGDVPICFFNSTVVGNLRESSFQDIWRSLRAREGRKWVRQCQGCWESCEVVPSAVYTGDIWKGLF